MTGQAAATTVSHTQVRMRPPDPYEADFHLLEELSKPPACVTSGRISIWVYRHNGIIVEIVLSGHAERQTCSAATSILVETAKRLNESVYWMLTCGAAVFRVHPQELDMAAQASSMLNSLPDHVPEEVVAQHPALNQARAVLELANRNQARLNEMVEALGELQRETGLVDVFERDWQTLHGFRSVFQQGKELGKPLIIVPQGPHNKNATTVLLPIVPDSRPNGEPLIFRLEGWDFDCPLFQQVADRHLHKMQRDLLRDALRRRRTYRRWLKEWMEDWIRELSYLPEEQASLVKLAVPPSQDSPDGDFRHMDVVTFLGEHARCFVDKGQYWPKQLLNIYKRQGFGQLDAAELDLPRSPKEVHEVDYHRGRITIRPAAPDDPPFTFRQRIIENTPPLITNCLQYIHRMDAIISPYERLRALRGAQRTRSSDGPDPGEREVRMMDELSRQIVMETMIRGWPSFYMDDEKDRAVFQAWADEYRPRIWAIMTDQAKEAGVSPLVLLEDNVVYDVRFNDDLGCTVQPLMLLDNTTHAQLHSTRVGASVGIPVWKRRSPRKFSAQVLGLGKTNSERAGRLVAIAAKTASGENPDLHKAARLLRLAIACHPSEAGRLILSEWSTRLGQETSSDFARAKAIIEAAELTFRHRYPEAKSKAEAYLASEPLPVGDAFVIAAMCELSGVDDSLAKLRELFVRRDTLRKEYEKLLPKVDAIREKYQGSGRLTHVEEQELLRWKRLQEVFERDTERAKPLEEKMECVAKEREALLAKAIASPASVRAQQPNLARAAEKSPSLLQALAKPPCLYGPDVVSEDFSRRYGAVRGVVELLGLLDLVYAFSRIMHDINEDAKAARLGAVEEMQKLSHDIWLPPVLEDELREVAKEFGKGEWDRLQTNQILGFLREANQTCQERMVSKINDQAVSRAPFAESLATRVHLTQVFESRYHAAFEMLLNANVSLKRAVNTSWTILDHELMDIPEGGKLYFDPGNCSIGVDSSGSRKPLVRAARLSPRMSAYLQQVISDPDLPSSIDRFAASLADGLLSTPVTPSRDWHLWKEVMQLIEDELLVVLSGFSYRANLMPAHSPSLTQTGKEAEKRMDMLIPHDTPAIDWDWKELGEWKSLVPPATSRVQCPAF